MSRGPQIRLSPQHGVNPSPKCFYCLQDKNQTMLMGLMRGGVEAPRNMVWDHEACDTCAGHMLQGVILISVRNDCEPGDENPYRTGGWVVITDDAIRRIEDRIHALKTASEHADTAARRRERELEKKLTASAKSQAKRIAALEATTRKQQTRIERQAGRLDRQRALIDELRADLARHQERAGLRGFVRRVRRRLGRSAG